MSKLSRIQAGVISGNQTLGLPFRSRKLTGTLNYSFQLLDGGIE
jgi:hypothetical protein